MDDKQIKHQLKQLLQNAYCPYSKVQVSAVLISKRGKAYSGVNVENASYGATICAERSALVSAIADGTKKGAMKALHVFSNLKKALFPCALCLQVLTEFFDAKSQIYIHGNKQVIVKTIAELVPYKVTKASF